MVLDLAFHHALQCLLYKRFKERIEMGRGLVEHQGDAWILQDHAGDGDSLSLSPPAGDIAALPDNGS